MLLLTMLGTSSEKFQWKDKTRCLFDNCCFYVLHVLPLPERIIYGILLILHPIHWLTLYAKRFFSSAINPLQNIEEIMLTLPPLIY